MYPARFFDSFTVLVNHSNPACCFLSNTGGLLHLPVPPCILMGSFVRQEHQFYGVQQNEVLILRWYPSAEL